jgi:putative NIF3 family GTP cyclohydrolase 1 type 2
MLKKLARDKKQHYLSHLPLDSTKMGLNALIPDLFGVEENVFAGGRVADGDAPTLLVDLAVLRQLPGRRNAEISPPWVIFVN